MEGERFLSEASCRQRVQFKVGGCGEAVFLRNFSDELELDVMALNVSLGVVSSTDFVSALCRSNRKKVVVCNKGVGFD
jgi:hypothetical protein